MTLKEYREKQNATQQDVADRSAVNRSSYANIENGKRRPSVEYAQRIAHVLGFDWTLFFRGKEADDCEFIPD